MSYKLIALDMDGTLCNDDKIIPKENIDAILELQEMGKKVAIVTGRPEAGILPFIEDLQLKKYGGYVVSYNGGRVYNTLTEECIYSIDFPHEEIKRVCKVMEETNCELTLTIPLNGKIFAWGKTNPHTYDESKVVKMPLFFTDDMDKQMQGVNFCKFLFAGEPDECDKYLKIFGEMYKGKFEVFKSEAHFLEITPLDVHKGNGLKMLNEIIGIKREETIACGDNFNDIEMIKYAGLGVAMKNSLQPIKDVADIIADTNNNCGVAKIIKEYMM